MKLRFLLEASFALSVLLAISIGHADSIHSLTKGQPQTEQVLGDSSHVALKARHPANARFLWVGLNALEDRDIDLPENGLTTEFETELDEEFHWVIPDTDDEKDYAPGQTTGKASLYGGNGIGTNFGDGRAFALGKIQVKYSGKTGLQANDDDFVHSYGRGPLSRSFSEAIWGEVGQDFPWGANQTLTVSDRGTVTTWPDGQKEREGLATRDNPLRPAHFVFRTRNPRSGEFPEAFLEQLKTQDEKRLKDSMLGLPDALPKPRGFDPNSPPNLKLRAGLEESFDRLAEQKAYEFANRFFHAAGSTSNMELDGKLLDYDTMTAQPHYMILKTTNGEVLGDAATPKNAIIKYLLASIEKYAPNEYRKGLPRESEFLARYDREYEFRLKRNFVELTGLPRDLVGALAQTEHARPNIESLGEILKQVALKGAKQFVLKEVMPDQAPTYDLPRILVSLASRNPLDRSALDAIIQKDLPDPKLREQLIDAYQAVMFDAVETAKTSGVALQALQRFMYENARIRNADVPDLHRPELRKENERLVDEYLRTGDRSAVWNSIDARIRRSRRAYKSDDPYQLIMDQDRDPFHHLVTLQVFNARENRYEVIVRARVKDGVAHFYTNKIPIEELKEARLHTSADGWKDGIKPEIHGDYVEFRVPTPRGTNIELALRSGDGGKWWKAGERNVPVSFIERNPIPAHPNSPDPRQIPELKPVTPEEERAVDAALKEVKEKTPVRKPGPAACMAKRFQDLWSNP